MGASLYSHDWVSHGPVTNSTSSLTPLPGGQGGTESLTLLSGIPFIPLATSPSYGELGAFQKSLINMTKDTFPTLSTGDSTVF